MIFDNVESIQEVAPFWPVSEHGSVLLTGRVEPPPTGTTTTTAQSTINVDSSLLVPSFARGDGSKLLRRLMGPSAERESVAAINLSEQLGGHPLAIAQIATRAREENMSVMATEFEYKCYAREILPGNDGEPNKWFYPNVASLWVRPFVRLPMPKHCLASCVISLLRDFMEACSIRHRGSPYQTVSPSSVMNPSEFAGISFRPRINTTRLWLHTAQYSIKPHSEYLPANKHSQPLNRRTHALESLLSLGLAQRNPLTGEISTHRLIQAEFTYRRMEKQEKQRAFEFAVALIRRRVPQITAANAYARLGECEACIDLASQVRAVIVGFRRDERDVPVQATHEFCDLLCGYIMSVPSISFLFFFPFLLLRPFSSLRTDGKSLITRARARYLRDTTSTPEIIKETLDFASRLSVEFERPMGGPINPSPAETRLFLLNLEGAAAHDAGDFPAAERAWRKCANARIRAGSDRRASAIGNLGLSLASQGKYWDALRCLRDARDIYVQQVNGVWSEPRASLCANIGKVHCLEGNLREGREVLEDTLERAAKNGYLGCLVESVHAQIPFPPFSFLMDHFG